MLKVKQCPANEIGPHYWTLVELAGFVDDGAWPISGGTLDQSKSFLQFVARWKANKSRLKAQNEQTGN